MEQVEVITVQTHVQQDNIVQKEVLHVQRVVQVNIVLLEVQHVVI